MDRAIVYLFEDSSWVYACEYNHGFHKEKGRYVEVIVGRGWSSREIGEMLTEYYEENFENLF
jgi:hypothetical protein